MNYNYVNYLFRVYLLKQGTLTNNKSWRGPAEVDLSSLKLPKGIGPYLMDFSKDVVSDLLTDINDIPMIDYANLGIHYNPWFIGHIALGLYSLWYRHKKHIYQKKFLKLVDWFLENAYYFESGVCWMYNFDWFGNSKPWFSSLAQAHAVSALIRAHYITNKEKYKMLANEAIKFMVSSIRRKGTATYEDDGTVFFHETLNTPLTYILNGHLFSCFALWEAGRYFNNDRYKKLADAGFEFVKKNLEKYDINFWSRYSLKSYPIGLPDIASPHYHDVHAAQLEIAAVIFNEESFLYKAKKFRQQQKSKYCKIKAMILKIFTKIMVFNY